MQDFAREAEDQVVVVSAQVEAPCARDSFLRDRAVLVGVFQRVGSLYRFSQSHEGIGLELGFPCLGR